jgi:hypothetical protein
MPTLGNTPRPAYVYDTETDTWVPVGVGAHTHDTLYVNQNVIDAKGDLLVGTADNAYSRLGKGADGTILVADNSTLTGLAWQPYGAIQVAGKNKIINGDFSIWQRGTSFSGGSGYKADRMFSDVGPSNVISRSTDVPSGQGFTYSYRFINTEVNCPIRHAIELPATGSLGVYQVGTTWTFSMWAKTSAARTINLYAAFTIGNNGTPEATPVNAVPIGTTSTAWQRFTYTFTIPAGTSLTSSTCFQITPFVTGTGTGIDTFFAGMQLESGPVATPFTTATGTIQGEIAACQRYYYKIGPSDGSSSSFLYSPLGMANATTQVITTFPFPQIMRVKPTSIEYTNPRVSDGANVSTATSLVLGDASSSLGSVNVNGSGFTVFRNYWMMNNSNSSLAFNAEL